MAKNTTNQKNQKVVSSDSKKSEYHHKRPKIYLQSMDGFLDQRLGWLIWVILGITFLFSLLLFDSRVSLSGDDSFYIIRAYDFIHSFKYPAFQGPLYPMVLSFLLHIWYKPGSA